jgi:hypothetical protein
LNENNHSFTKFTDPALKMKSVLDAALNWRIFQFFLTLRSISCSTTHHTPVAEECPENRLGTGGVQAGTHSKSQDVSVTDSYILRAVQRISNPGGHAGTACFLGLRIRITPGAWMFVS